MEIIPAVLTSDPSELKYLIDLAEGNVKKVQIDIIDGIFEKNKTINPESLKYLETSILFDIQLMVKEPISWTERCVLANTDRIIGHIELMSDQLEFAEKVQSLGLKIGLGLDLDTPVEKIYPRLINDIDVILLMSTKAGFGGQKFQEKVFEKIKKLNKIRENDQSPFKICVDGGITKDQAPKLQELKVDEIAVGRRLLNENITDELKSFQKLIS